MVFYVVINLRHSDVTLLCGKQSRQCDATTPDATRMVYAFYEKEKTEDKKKFKNKKYT